MRDLTPRDPAFGGRERMPARSEASWPFHFLHRDVNRLFDDAFRNLSLGGEFAGFGATAWPSIEVSDNEKEIRVAAELPGLEEKDIHVEITEGVLSIRGEKRTEVEDKEKRYSERSYGRFERRLSLPADIDENQVSATFKNGVLNITLPRSERARQESKRIAIGKT